MVCCGKGGGGGSFTCSDLAGCCREVRGCISVAEPLVKDKDGRITLDCSKPLPDQCRQQLKGDPGTPGRDGTDGRDGQRGAQGPDGPQGPPGVQGERGPEGPAGHDGTDGQPGKDGDPGPRGAEGPAGRDGKIDASNLGCGLHLDDQTQKISALVAPAQTIGDKQVPNALRCIPGPDGGLFVPPGDGSGTGGVTCDQVPSCVPTGDALKWEDGKLVVAHDDSLTVTDGRLGLDCSKPLPEPCRQQLKGDTGAAGRDGTDGAPGQRGPEGPEGPQGPPGVAGERGPEGPTGRDGDPGGQGPAGQDGTDGTPGKDGDAGKSAYEIAKELDPDIGTESEWIASLKGAKGDTGLTGPPGRPGDPGKDGSDGKDGSFDASMVGCGIAFDAGKIKADHDESLTCIGGDSGKLSVDAAVLLDRIKGDEQLMAKLCELVAGCLPTKITIAEC